MIFLKELFCINESGYRVKCIFEVNLIFKHLKKGMLWIISLIKEKFHAFIVQRSIKANRHTAYIDEIDILIKHLDLHSTLSRYLMQFKFRAGFYLSFISNCDLLLSRQGYFQNTFLVPIPTF